MTPRKPIVLVVTASFVDDGVELVRWPPERRPPLRAVRGRLRRCSP